PTSPTCSTRRCCGPAASTGGGGANCPAKPAVGGSPKAPPATCPRRRARAPPSWAGRLPGFPERAPSNPPTTPRPPPAPPDQTRVRPKDFLDAMEKIVLGPERPLLLSREDKQRIAVHEGGHAILGLVVPGADPVNRVTIVPRGEALGVTYQRPDTDRYNYPE